MREDARITLGGNSPDPSISLNFINITFVSPNVSVCVCVGVVCYVCVCCVFS